jgi:hypothetical protein
MAVLGPHALHYPEGSHKILKGVQTNGQLMGSILSFPILCLANLGVYLAVTSVPHWQHGWSDQDRLSHVLVNGDDMVYAADESLWPMHVSYAASVGLEMSVGKAYVHDTYVNINSTSIHYSLKRDCTPWQIDYLNAGLYYGQHKVQKKLDGREKDEGTNSGDQHELAQEHSKADRSSLVGNLNVVLAGSLPGRQSELLKRFINEHSSEIFDECRAQVRSGKYRGLKVVVRNLFLPICNGGMGVNPPDGWKFVTTKMQMKIANALRERSDAPRTTQLPTMGYELTKVETDVTAPWKKKELSVDLDELEFRWACSKSYTRKMYRVPFVHYGPNRWSVTT